MITIDHISEFCNLCDCSIEFSSDYDSKIDYPKGKSTGWITLEELNTIIKIELQKGE